MKGKNENDKEMHCIIEWPSALETSVRFLCLGIELPVDFPPQNSHLNFYILTSYSGIA
jgi:hypothetical protein